MSARGFADSVCDDTISQKCLLPDNLNPTALRYKVRLATPSKLPNHTFTSLHLNLSLSH